MNFSERFRQECIVGSAIAPSLYESAVEIIEDTGLWEPNRALNWRVRVFWQTKPPHSFETIAMFVSEDGSFWQGKPEHHRIDRDGKTVKYEAPVGAGSRAFLPPVPLEIRRAVGAPETGSFWDWLEEHPEMAITLTEGGKKAMALLSNGSVAIGLFGVASGVLKNENVNGQKMRRLWSELIPDLARFAVPGREFTLAFDADEKPSTRNKVSYHQRDLAFHLSREGCQVAIASWDPSEGKGVDDLIVNQGVARWREVLESARPWKAVQNEHAVASRLTREPSLHIGTDEFGDHAHNFPTSGIVALYGGKGTGKGKAIGKMVEGETWIGTLPTRSNCRDLAETLGGVYIHEGDRYGNTLLKDGKPCSGGVTPVPSLLKFQGIPADDFILDEIQATLEFLLTSDLANKNGIRPLLIEELESRIRTAPRVIAASADLAESALRYVEELRGERAFLVRSDRKPLTYPHYLIDSTHAQAQTMMLAEVEAFHASGREEVMILPFDTKAEANQVAGRLTAMGIQSLLVTANTTGDEEVIEFLSSKGADIPKLIEKNKRIIITSPTVKEGFSIEQNTNLIHSVWAMFSGCSITATAMAQTLDRVRSASVPRFVWVAKKGRAYSKISRAQSIPAFLRDFQRSSNTLVRLVRQSLLTETQVKINGMNWESPLMRVLADIEVERNRDMKDLRARFIAKQEAEGKLTQFLTPTVSVEQVRATREAMQTIKSQQQIERAIALEQMPCPSIERIQELEGKENLLPSEALELERFKLDRFYQKTCDRDDVLWDANGRRRSQIGLLEAILWPEKAEARSADSINRNPTTPQVWKKIKLQQAVYEASGAGDLIRRICSGEIDVLTADLIQPIAEWLKRHPKDVQLAGIFTNIEKISDRQAVFRLLDLCGITRLSSRPRVNGEVGPRVYRVDPENLAKLKATIERRSQADPPRQELDLNQGDGSPDSNAPPPPNLPPDLIGLWPYALDPDSKRELIETAAAYRLAS